jgi:hypothetical protein
MIWHIAKKDLKLLWPLAACFGAVYALIDAWMLSLGRFGSTVFTGHERSSMMVAYLPWIALAGSAVLATIIVQQDALPGARQDWLVRPIRRLDLLAAKIVAVLILVIAPIFVAHCSEALLTGFGVTQSAGAAGAVATYVFLAMAIPVIALASLTRNLMEAIVGAVIVMVVGPTLSRLVMAPLFVLSTMQLPVAWIDVSIRSAILIAAACALLAVQYYFRKTTAGRWALGCAILVTYLLPVIPWQSAFAMQQRLAPAPGSGGSVAINFVPTRELLEDRKVGPGTYRGYGDVFIVLPVRATGVPEKSILLANLSTASLIPPQGQTEHLGTQNGFQITKQLPGDGQKPITYGIRVPAALYQRIADQPVRLEIDYSLTLMGQADAQSLPAVGGDGRSPLLGWCGTKVDRVSSEVLFGCVRPGSIPRCTVVMLEHKPSGASNKKYENCGASYAPIRDRYEIDALSRFGLTIPFADVPTGDPLTVTEAMLPESQVTARVYEPRDYFSRLMVIPEIKLRDWAME